MMSTITIILRYVRAHLTLLLNSIALLVSLCLAADIALYLGNVCPWRSFCRLKFCKLHLERTICICNWHGFTSRRTIFYSVSAVSLFRLQFCITYYVKCQLWPREPPGSELYLHEKPSLLFPSSPDI